MGEQLRELERSLALHFLTPSPYQREEQNV